MKINEIKKDDIVILELEGRLDSATAPDLEKKVLALIEQSANKILLDFNNLDYISSAGLRVVLMGAKKTKASGGKIVLCALKEHVKEVFDIAGFSSILSICLTSEEAINDF